MAHSVFVTPALRRRAILLARLSDNREDVDLTDEGIPKSLDDQIKRMTDRAEQLGWDVWKVIKNPRLSAYKKRKVTLPNGNVDYRVWRPDLREAMDDLWAGRANAMIALDLDRAFRDPKDLQDLVNVVDHAKHDIVVESVTGSLRMTRGHDPFDAEIRVLVANKSSRDTARRVAAARERRALEGRFGGGKRPFGFASDGVTLIKSEAKEIQNATRDILNGASLRAVTQSLRDRKVPTVKGGLWDPTSVKDILCRARNAGIIVYKGEELAGVAAPWQPIVTREELEALRAKLTVRRASPERAMKWLGSNLYFCTCGGVLQAHAQSTRVPRYRCRDTGLMAGKHASRIASELDHYVTGLIIEWCSQPNAMSLLMPSQDSGVNLDELRVEAEAKRKELEDIAILKNEGKLKLNQVVIMSAPLNERLDEIEAVLSSTVSTSPIAQLIEAGMGIQDKIERRAKVRSEWNSYDLGMQRAILRRLIAVTLLHARRGPGFDPNFVKIEWVYEREQPQT